MKLTSPMAASVLAIALAACSDAPDAPAPQPEKTASQEMTGAAAGIGRATGIIRSIGSEGNFLTIDHGPFSGDIEMGAMMMGFDTLGDVDLSGFAEGDQVAFAVKLGRDGSYRVMAICKTDAMDSACLDISDGQ